MSQARYERVSGHDEDEGPIDSAIPHQHHPIPASPPPSFRSQASSPTSQNITDSDPLTSSADRTLADAFDSPDDEASCSEHEDGLDDRQRLMRGNSSHTDFDNRLAGWQDSSSGGQQSLQRQQTLFPALASVPQSQSSGRVYGRGSNDGVFANLSAKPTRGEQEDEKPPSYEQAAADATPPYWETTILAPGMVSDEVFVDGLPVGSVFSFVWNAMISMSFQLVGFLLTYLLHTTHAAKNGSRAGLGITLIQYGFSMKGASLGSASAGTDFGGAPPDPNRHDFDPNTVGPEQGPVTGDGAAGGISTNDWIAYILMIMGWFILIKSVNDFLKARRHEQLVLQSPERGLSVPVVAEGERPESTV